MAIWLATCIVTVPSHEHPVSRSLCCLNVYKCTKNLDGQWRMSQKWCRLYRWGFIAVPESYQVCAFSCWIQMLYICWLWQSRLWNAYHTCRKCNLTLKFTLANRTSERPLSMWRRAAIPGTAASSFDLRLSLFCADWWDNNLLARARQTGLISGLLVFFI